MPKMVNNTFTTIFSLIQAKGEQAAPLCFYTSPCPQTYILIKW